MEHKIERRRFLQSLAAGTAVFSLPVHLDRAASEEIDSSPNIIFTMVDDLGYD